MAMISRQLIPVDPNMTLNEALNVKPKEDPQLQEFPGVIDFKHFLSFTWTLRFKRGQLTYTKNFYFAGSMTDAKCRAYAHCGAMDYVFINIARFIVDLDHQEEYKRKGNIFEETS